MQAQDTDRPAALHWCAASLPWMTSSSRIDDEETGAEIVRRALKEPLRHIVANSGEEGAIVVGKIRDSKENNYGYNAQSDKFEDLVKAGVIDPAKVTRTALQNAASIAALMLITEALVSDVPEDKKAPAAAASTAACPTADKSS